MIKTVRKNLESLQSGWFYLEILHSFVLFNVFLCGLLLCTCRGLSPYSTAPPWASSFLLDTLVYRFHLFPLLLLLLLSDYPRDCNWHTNLKLPHSSSYPLNFCIVKISSLLLCDQKHLFLWNLVTVLGSAFLSFARRGQQIHWSLS